MKKFYSTILASLLGTAALMAEEGTFTFIHNGEVVANGSTLTISEVHCTDLGDDMKIWEMPANLYVRNNEESAQKLTLLGTGIENFNDIQICPDGNCLPWNTDGTLTASFKNAIPAGENADTGIHVSYYDFENLTTFNYKASITLRAYCTLDPEDFTEITLVFDSNASSLSKVEANNDLEIYNICGRMIGKSAKGLKTGIYIFRQGGVSRKVVIK